MTSTKLYGAQMLCRLVQKTKTVTLSDSNGGTMEAQQQSDHLGDQGGLATCCSPTLPQCGSPHLFYGTGESPDEVDVRDLWQ
ncbi:unnamed protein product [Musa acuminata subsp. malaccensis]|uniref:(wild Malaysian banana) hypothetical protein n=1 Tax=Musa acuminata subsp. malaccensis TaxID=214687 RepID=A0A804IH00_MUSAM|nr:unnamed protein product [Musa acuminata subsp. malaccensis]